MQWGGRPKISGSLAPTSRYAETHQRFSREEAMKTRQQNAIFSLLPWTALAFAVTVTLVACNADALDDSRPGFDGVDSGGDAPASLPDGAAVEDARSDAGDPRDPFIPDDEPVTCPGTAPCATALAAGAKHFCALMSDGRVRCWGSDD